jgi:hypothetical protein
MGSTVFLGLLPALQSLQLPVAGKLETIKLRVRDARMVRCVRSSGDTTRADRRVSSHQRNLAAGSDEQAQNEKPHSCPSEAPRAFAMGEMAR